MREKIRDNLGKILVVVLGLLWITFIIVTISSNSDRIRSSTALTITTALEEAYFEGQRDLLNEKTPRVNLLLNCWEISPWDNGDSPTHLNMCNKNTKKGISNGIYR